MQQYYNPILFILLLLITTGCNQNATNKESSDPVELVGEVDIPELPEDAKTKNKIQPPRTEVPAPKKLNTANPEVPDDIESELPDFSSYTNTTQKKQEFFEFLRPIVEAENERVLAERGQILELMLKLENGDALTESELQDLEKLAEKYRVNDKVTGSEEFFRAMLLHVDIIPAELALVQAANESAWGSSYFARHGNNIFGRWCFTPGCGVVPRKRMTGDTHEVAVYDDLAHSVRSYIRYLNSHPAFRQLRVVRYEAREAGIAPSGYDMAIGLQKYSGIGMEYVNTLRSMMRHNLKYMDLQTPS